MIKRKGKTTQKTWLTENENQPRKIGKEKTKINQKKLAKGKGKTNLL